MQKLSLTPTLLEDIINKRIAFLKQRPDLFSQTVIPSAERDNFYTILHDVFSHKCSYSFLTTLESWCNDSIRHIGDIASQIISILATDGDPAHTLSDMLIPSAQPRREISTRRLRTYLYKFIICGPNPVYDSEVGVLNIFDSVHRTPFLPLPEFAILTYLRNRQIGGRGHISTLGDLRATFAEFGLTNDVLSDILQRLRSRQALTHFGLICVHNEDAPVTPDTSPNVLIEILENGAFFVDYLCRSCEYTFWAAMDCGVSVSLHGKAIEYRGTGPDEGLKLLIAAKFLKYYQQNFLIPAQKKLSAHLHLRAAYENIFSDRHSNVGKTVISIRKFVPARKGFAKIATDILLEVEDDVLGKESDNG